MSTHFHNVNTLLECTESNDVDQVVELLRRMDTDGGDSILYSEAELLARDILFMLISYWSGMTPEARIHVREVVSSSAVDTEIEDIFWKEEDE